MGHLRPWGMQRGMRGVTRAIAVPGLIWLAAAATLLPASAGEVFAPGGVAINGYDPVSYFTEGQPVAGQATITTDWQGATFRFASDAHRRAFLANPARYAPQYGGYCAYGMARGYKATTEPQAFTIVGGKLYLNYSDTVQDTWRADVPGYVARADANWPDVRATPDP